MNAWHDLSLGSGFPDVLTCVIEVPKASGVKYRFNEKTGMLHFGNFLSSTIRYPANYGFFPKTLEADGGGLDVFVLGREPLHPLSIVEVRPIGGALVTSVEKGKEIKLVAVADCDHEFEDIKSLKELPYLYIEELTQFLEHKSTGNKNKDNKKVLKFFGLKKTHQLIKESAKRYAAQK